MSNADELVGYDRHENSVYSLAQPGQLYLVYLLKGGTTTLDLTAASGEFSVSWFNPREGGALQPGAKLRAGAKATLTAPDANDWLSVVVGR